MVWVSSHAKNELGKATFKKIEWYPPGRRRKRRPRNSWILEVTIGMRDKRIYKNKWIDMEVWKRKVKF